jgi:hypothetical protein
MRSLFAEVGWLGLVASVLWASAGAAPAQAPPASSRGALRTSVRLPLEELPAPIRDTVTRIVEQPTLFASAPSEDFNGPPGVYQWLLDHPDRAAMAWHRLGSPCLEITDHGAGWFGWTDQQGSELRWETVYRTPQVRVWYAEGKAKPGMLIPPMAVRAVVVMHHGTYTDSTGRPRVCHQSDLYFQTDSRTAAVLARLLGSTAPRLAEQCVTQMQIFFSALTRYVDRHPERAEMLFCGEPPLGQAPTTDSGERRAESGEQKLLSGSQLSALRSPR